MDLRNILLLIHVCFVYSLIHVSHHEHIHILYCSTPLTVIVCTARYRLVTKEYPSRLDRATEPSRRIAMMASRLIRVRRLKSESIFWILSFVSLLMIIIITTTYIYTWYNRDRWCPQQWGCINYRRSWDIHTYIHTYIQYMHTYIHTYSSYFQKLTISLLYPYTVSVSCDCRQRYYGSFFHERIGPPKSRPTYFPAT